ncbi:PAS domain S-box protein [Magnetovibrio sp.]|uniref:PAS domain S-box protein n=1 Tax=Magnetovibrio sp. TaxID=2024836 RepID=UPI002F9341A9
MTRRKPTLTAAGRDPLPRRIKMPPRPDSPEQRLHDIVSTVGDWIWETNEILELTFISDRFMETTGLPPEALKGRTLQQVVLADDRIGVKDANASPVSFTLDHREPFRDIACSLIAADGSILHFTLSGIPFYSDNNMFRGYRGAAHNITPQLESQRKYHHAKKKAVPYQLAEVSRSDALKHAAKAKSHDEAFVIYDQNGNLMAASEGYAKLYPALDDVIIPGATLKDILTEAARRLEIKEAQGRMGQWVDEKLAERLNPQPTHQEIYRGGRWWRIHEQRTREGQVLSLHTDITHIKDMEASLLDAETRYRKLVEMAPDLTCVVTDGIITLMNSAGAEMLRADDPRSFIGKSFDVFVHPDFREILHDEIEQLFEEKWMPMRLVRTDGVVIDAELSALPFSERGLKTVMLVARDTSDRKRAAEALIHRDVQLQGIMETVVDGIITIDQRGIVQSFNPAAEKIFGYRAHEVIGNNVKMLMPAPYAEAHDGYLDRYRETKNPTIIGKGREVSGLRKNGSQFPLDLSVSELRRDGKSLYIGVVRDITERKKNEQALQESRARYELAISGAGEGIWDWDMHSDQLYISAKIRDLTGYKTNFIKAKSWLRLIHREDRGEYQRRLTRHLKGETPSFFSECRLCHKDGSWRWIRISGMALRDKAGWVYRMAGSVGDITQRIEFQHQLIEAKERAEIASRVKTEFLANMSHELRTPLNAIIGFSDVMLSGLFGGLEPRYQEYIENIRDSGSHLLAVINDILDVSRIEAGRMDLRPERISIAELIESATRLIRDRATEAGLSMNRRVPKDLPDLMVDSQRIKQVLLNILSNAVKFTPEGGKVTVKANLSKSNELTISVSDTGIGMSEAEIATALTPFGQVDSKLARKFDGTGLGLPLTKSFVELHGGILSIKSTPKQGTTVSVRFPTDRLVR